MKMNPEVKTKWVAALRSGEYQQGMHRLRTNGGGYCCLGVLCDVHQKETKALAWEGQKYDYQDTHPPVAVNVWAGFNDRYATPVVTINGRSAFLTDHNDSGKTFAQIADAIEEQL